MREERGNSVLPPVVAGTTVYTVACNCTSGQGTPTLYALDGQHGYVIWKHPLSQPLASSPHPLVVADNVLIYGTLSYTSKAAEANETGASLIALRASDGRVLWQTWIGGFADPSLTVDRQTVYAVTIDPGGSTTRLHAWQIDNGQQRWSTSL